MTEGEVPIDILCGMCGGKNVSRDAWASWDVAAQDWVLGAVFDEPYCHDCEESWALVEKELVLP